MIICIDIGRKFLDLYCLCFTILHLLLNKVGQLHLFSRCQRNLTLLIRFEPLREPLMRFQTVNILKLQLYNVDMTFQNKFGTVDFDM